MKRRRLLGISCALVVLALGAAVSPARAQLLLPAPPPVGTQSLNADKIDPALLALMQADPQKLLPVIVEMQQPLPPFIGAPNVDRSLEALDLLRVYGISVAALSLIDGAAGFANAAGIDALSLVPTVAFIHHDATVGPQPSAPPPVVAPPDQVSGVYPQVVKADRVWQQGISGNGVTVHWPSSLPMDLQMASAKGRLEVPVKIFMLF